MRVNPRGALRPRRNGKNVPSVAGFPKGVAQTVVAVATVCCSPPRERWECVGFKMRSPERGPRHARFSRGGVSEASPTRAVFAWRGEGGATHGTYVHEKPFARCIQHQGAAEVDRGRFSAAPLEV